MNLHDIEIEFRNSTIIKSERHFVRYLKMINYFQNNIVVKNKTQKGFVENHHILPRAIFPEYSKEKWNLVNLPVKAHYLVHFLLYKSISHVSCLYSFNQMRRVSKGSGKLNCRLYASARKDFAIAFSILNTGRKLSEDVRNKMSLKNKDTNVYRNTITGERKRLKKGTQPEGWILDQYGRTHTDQYKKDMSIRVTGSFWQYKDSTKEVKYDKFLHDGFIEGYPDWLRGEEFIQKMEELIWISNNNTNETMRINKDEEIPDGYEKGRKCNHIGFSIINNNGKKRVIDLKDKVVLMIDTDILDRSRYINSYTSIDKTFLFNYNGVCYSYLDLLDVNKELPDFACRNLKLNDKIVPKPHSNMTVERHEFCKINQGKTMSDIGLKSICILDFEFGKDKLYVRR